MALTASRSFCTGNHSLRIVATSWPTDIVPLDASASLSRQFAAQFAQSALRTVFLLNGGAFVAVPAFIKLVDVSIKHELTFFVASLSSFLIGVVLTAVATIFAFKSANFDAWSIYANREAIKIRLNKGQSPASFGEVQAQLLFNAEQEAKRYLSSRVRAEAWALRLGVGGIVAFVFGAAAATVVLARS